MNRLNLLNRTLHVVESVSEARGGLIMKPPKNGRRRVVTLPSFIANMLSEQVDEYPSPDGFVFTAPMRGQVRHRNFMDDHFYPVAKRLTWLPAGFRFHDLRHTHAAILIARGWNPKQIQERLGHGSIRTTYDRDGHLFDQHDAELLDELDSTIRDSLAASSRPERGLVVPIRESGTPKKGP